MTMNPATKMAKGPPLAIQLTKRAIYKGLTRDLTSQVEYEAYAQVIAGTTKDTTKEGVRAFMEKRDHEFKGR
jgi:2-(1,2-epoxy-1,2-dihydrophenyl)acetyl-CoA isomerase